MRHPYQCLALAQTGKQEEEDVLIAACGSEVYVHRLDTGELLAVWPEPPKEDYDAKDSSPEIVTESKNGEEVRPTKRRKKSKPKGSAASGPSFTKFLMTEDGRHLVATTGEDKSVLVFSIGKGGILSLLSKRQMTKRPCAIALTSENDYILVGDKFGDVYALPLHPSTSENGKKLDLAESIAQTTSKPYKPAASETTVHTVRNRKVLEAQLKAAPTEAKEKETMDFEHEMLLGHVSMLTDIATVEVKVPRNANHNVTTTRNYILTADRDEHIRVSRGRPQAWIIENYCFGHTQFVNKLCLPTADILVSGGGDDHLFVWDWRNSRLLGKLNIQGAVAKYWEAQSVRSRRTKKDVVQQANDEALILQDSIEAAHSVGPGNAPEELEAEDGLQDKIAVSGLWARSPVKDETKVTEIFCACEAIPAIFAFAFPTSMEPFSEEEAQLRVFPLVGNPLDLTLLLSHFLVAVDNVHEPASKNAVRRHAESIERLQCIASEQNAGENSTSGNPYTSLINAMTDSSRGPALVEEAGSFKSLQELVYGVENLRKRGNEDT